jgi:hypothetical protein
MQKMPTEDEVQAGMEAKLLANPKLGHFLNFTTKWGCGLSDTTLRRPLLILSFVLVIGSCVTQKFAFLGLLISSSNTWHWPWIWNRARPHLLFALLVKYNYTGGPFVDPWNQLNWTNPVHESFAIDLASPSNPRNLSLLLVKQTVAELCMYPEGAGWSTGGADDIDFAGQSLC